MGHSDCYPGTHPLTLDRWTRPPTPPPSSSFIGPLIMLTCHIKIKLSMQCLWYGEEVSRSETIKRLSVQLACNLVAQVWTWRGKGKGAAAPAEQPTAPIWGVPLMCFI